MAALENPVDLACDLIRCQSVTPEDDGALKTLAAALEQLGFTCHHLTFDEPGTAPVANLYARRGASAPNLCFAGHTDVVPVGEEASWSVEPFAARVEDGVLFGRGATDMKGAIAAFVAAIARLDDADSSAAGSLSLLITGDEEGPAINGTRKVLDWLTERGETLDACIVGEPTNPTSLGEMAKIGRRGSLNGTIRVIGTQGHVAYPHLADNPLPRLIAMLHRITALELDQGTEHFQPSNLEITTIDVGNQATNVIPAEASARLNIRFNNRHTSEELLRLVRAECDAVGGPYELSADVTGEAFLTPPGRLSEIVSTAVESVIGERPELSTTGGTSDARFIKDACPVVEFGLISQTMHKTDERIAVADLENLTAIYQAMIECFFKADWTHHS